MSSKQSFVSNQVTKAVNLPSPSDMQSNLQKLLSEFALVKWVDKTESTNSDLYKIARNSTIANSKPCLLGAHLQVQGRGRLGRTWQNRSGANLMFSCLFDVIMPANKLPSISILCGISACKAIQSLLLDSQQTNLKLKWPNDILWQQNKLAGILVEVTKSQSTPKHKDRHSIIVGMGINLNDANTLSSSLNRQVADWAQIANENACIQDIGAVDLVYTIAKAWYYEMNNIDADLNNLQNRFTDIDALHNQYINIIDNDKIIDTGLAYGVNELGQLLINNSNGIHAVNIGEVSVRPNKTLNSHDT